MKNEDVAGASYNHAFSDSNDSRNSQEQPGQTTGVAADHQADGTQFRKTLGCSYGFSMVVGIIVGSGTFVSPSLIVKFANDTGLALIALILCGIIALMGALCYSELGCMFKKSGGDYLYILEIYGDVPAFLCSWIMNFILYPSGLAIQMLTFGSYLVKAFYSDCNDNESLMSSKLLAVVGIGIVALINCWSPWLATRAQSVFTTSQVLAVSSILLLGIWQVAIGRTENYNSMFDVKSFDFQDLGQFGLALYSGLWSFAGWTVITMATEEFKNVEKNLILATISGVSFSLLLYISIHLALISVLTTNEIASSVTVALTFFHRLFGKNYVYIIQILAAITSFGSGNASLFCISRGSVAAARQGHLPFIFSTIHSNKKTPVPSIILISLISVFILIPDNNSLSSLIEHYGLATWLISLMTILGVIILRIKKPDYHRPFRVHIIIPIVMVTVSAFLVFVPFIKKPTKSAISLTVILAGLPIYYIFIYKQETHPLWLKNFMEKLNYKMQCLCNVLPAEY